MDPLTILSVAEALRGGSRKQGVLGMIGSIGVKNLLALIGLAVVAFGVAGWHLGWYTITTHKDALGHTQVDVQSDLSKVGQDGKKLEKALGGVLEQGKGAVQPALTTATQQAEQAVAPTMQIDSGSGPIRIFNQPAVVAPAVPPEMPRRVGMPEVPVPPPSSSPVPPLSPVPAWAPVMPTYSTPRVPAAPSATAVDTWHFSP